MAVVAVLLFGCNGPTSPAAVFDIEGGWNYSESVQSSAALSSCSFLGTITFVQNEDTFNGTYTRTISCIGVATSNVSQQNGSIIAGLFIEDFIQFKILDCDYRGQLVGDALPLRLSGTVICPRISADGTVTSASGTWSADKLTNGQSS